MFTFRSLDNQLKEKQITSDLCRVGIDILIEWRIGRDGEVLNGSCYWFRIDEFKKKTIDTPLCNCQNTHFWWAKVNWLVEDLKSLRLKEENILMTVLNKVYK